MSGKAVVSIAESVRNVLVIASDVVSVKTSRSRDVLMSHLGFISNKILNVSVLSWSRTDASRGLVSFSEQYVSVLA